MENTSDKRNLSYAIGDALDEAYDGVARAIQIANSVNMYERPELADFCLRSQTMMNILEEIFILKTRLASNTKQENTK